MRELNSKKPRLTGSLRSLNEEDRTVELSFSSETGVERRFGIEVLGHNRDEVRLERLNSGAPFLLNHDRWDQVGVVVEGSASIVGGKGRCTVKVSRSAKGEETLQDIRDGIKRNCSVYYNVFGMELAGERDGVQIYRVTDWEPTEVSLVSVPADPTVGVGRSADDEEDEDMPGKVNDNEKNKQTSESVEESRSMPEGSGTPKINVSAVREEARKLEQERVRNLIQLGEHFGQRDLADRYVSEGRGVDEFNKVLLEKLAESRSQGEEVKESSVGMSKGDVESYSFIRAIRALANPTDRRVQEAAAFEFECSRAASEKMGRSPEGLVVPYDVLSRGLLQSGTPAAGGYTIDTTLMTSSFIELLRSKAIALQMASPLSGLVGNVDIPGQASGSTGYWVGADEDVQETEPTFNHLTMSPKTVGAYSEITRRLLMQSSLDVEALVRYDLAKALALTIDKAAFYGSGEGEQPLGIMSTSGINAVDFAAENPTYAELVAMESEIAADDADVSGMCYIGNARFRGHCKTTEKFSGTSGATIWEKGDSVNGYAAKITNQMVTGDVLFGNFSDLIVGMWGGLELTSDPYSHSLKGRLRIVAMQDVDFAVRHVESFCYGVKPAVSG